MGTQLRQLQATQGRSDLLAALFAAVQAEHDPLQSSRRIVVLTDGQAADWGLKNEMGWKRFHEAVSASPVASNIEMMRLDQVDGRPATANLPPQMWLSTDCRSDRLSSVSGKESP